MEIFGLMSSGYWLIEELRLATGRLKFQVHILSLNWKRNCEKWHDKKRSTKRITATSKMEVLMEAYETILLFVFPSKLLRFLCRPCRIEGK
jgi:hypothetical protein